MATDLKKPPGSWWNKAVWSGVLGALAMGIYMMIVTAAAGPGFWMPLNMIAATFPAFRPPVEGFAFAVTTTGLIIHLIVGALWGVVLGFFVSRIPDVFRTAGGASLVGLGWGLVVWIVSGLLIGPAINPALAMANPVNYFIGHMIYGVATGLILWGWAHNRELSEDYLRRRQAGGLRPSPGT